MLNINKASRTIWNGICHKSQQLQLVKIREMLSVNPAWNILTCTLQNMDEEMSTLDAVKIVHKHIHGKVQNIDPWSMDPLRGPGPWTGSIKIWTGCMEPFHEFTVTFQINYFWRRSVITNT